MRQGDVSGAYFLWGWLSRPWGLPWTTAGLGLPCAFGCLEFDHPFAVGKLRGEVQARAGRFAYHGEVKSSRQGAPGAPGLLGRFALERYTGLFHHHGVTRRFETQHAPWTAVEVSVEVEEDKLVRTVFPWFSQARLVAAHYAPGVTDVWLSQPRAMQSKS